MPTADAYGIVANVEQRDTALRRNARVWVCCIPGDPCTVFVRGMSKGGREIQKWIQTSHLSNFRVKWIPRRLRSMWRDRVVPQKYNTRADAEREMNRTLPGPVA